MAYKSVNLTHLQTYKRFDTDNNNYNNEFQGIFNIKWNGNIADLHFNDGEVEQVKWMSLSEVLSHLQAGGQDWTNCGYEEQLIIHLLDIKQN